MHKYIATFDDEQKWGIVKVLDLFVSCLPTSSTDAIFAETAISKMKLKTTQSCETSNCLHRSNLPNQILPQEKTNLTLEFYEIEINGYFWGKNYKFYAIWLAWRQNHVASGRISPKTTLFYKTVWSLTLSTRTFQKFYTDISAISVTFRNSETTMMSKF